VAAFLPCPWLGSRVEFTDERRFHVLVRHRQLLIRDAEPIRLAIKDPDWIRQDDHSSNVHLFVRSYPFLEMQGYVVAVVASPAGPRSPWLITAFPARRPSRGGIVWRRN
jgi:hypothetical protein